VTWVRFADNEGGRWGKREERGDKEERRVEKVKSCLRFEGVAALGLGTQEPSRGQKWPIPRPQHVHALQKCASRQLSGLTSSSSTPRRASCMAISSTAQGRSAHLHGRTTVSAQSPLVPSSVDP